MRNIYVVLVFACSLAFTRGQGIVFVGNFDGGLLDAPFFSAANNQRLSGDAYQAQLYVLTGDKFLAVGTPMGFFTGAGAGYIDNSEHGLVNVPGHPPGSRPYVVLAIWESAYGVTFEEASVNGRVGTYGPWQLQQDLGDGGAIPAASLLGLNPFSLYSPGISFGSVGMSILRPAEQTSQLIWGDSYPLDWKIEYQTSLSETNWTLLTTGQSTNRIGNIYTDNTATNQSRIYRIQYTWPDED